MLATTLSSLRAAEPLLASRSEWFVGVGTMASITEAPFGARIYFLQAGAIFVRQTVLRGLIYRCDGWRGGIAKPGSNQAREVMRLITLAREGVLPSCDSEGRSLEARQNVESN